VHTRDIQPDRLNILPASPRDIKLNVTCQGRIRNANADDEEVDVQLQHLTCMLHCNARIHVPVHLALIMCPLQPSMPHWQFRSPCQGGRRPVRLLDSYLQLAPPSPQSQTRERLLRSLCDPTEHPLEPKKLILLLDFFWPTLSCGPRFSDPTHAAVLCRSFA
jgi:hypothetical protein